MDKRALQFYVDTLKDKYTYNFKWLGRPVIQMPQDLMGIQELIFKIQPDYVIETGVAHGGGLIFYASILEAIGHGHVIGIDIDIRPHNLAAIREHRLSKRITLYEGSSVRPDLFKRVMDKVGKKSSVIVILDSNHTCDHVYQELRLYADLVSKGSYMVVLDTVIQFLPEDTFPDRPWGVGNNPWTATMLFLGDNTDFAIDKEIENRLLLTCAPDGWLMRK